MPVPLSGNHRLSRIGVHAGGTRQCDREPMTVASTAGDRIVLLGSTAARDSGRWRRTTRAQAGGRARRRRRRLPGRRRPRHRPTAGRVRSRVRGRRRTSSSPTTTSTTPPVCPGCAAARVERPASAAGHGRPLGTAHHVRAVTGHRGRVRRGSPALLASATCSAPGPSCHVVLPAGPGVHRVMEDDRECGSRRNACLPRARRLATRTTTVKSTGKVARLLRRHGRTGREPHRTGPRRRCPRPRGAGQGQRPWWRGDGYDGELVAPLDLEVVPL